MTFDPIRQEELRIMGFGHVAHDGSDLRDRMAKQLTVAGPHDVTKGRVEAEAGDYLVEFEDGTTELLDPAEFEQGCFLMPPDPVEPSPDPVELAQPVGLLQRDDSADDEGAADA